LNLSRILINFYLLAL